MLLRDIGVLVPLVGTKRIKRPNTHDADDAAEDIGLLKIQVDQIFSLLFNKINRVKKVRYGQTRRQRDSSVEAISGKSQVGICLFRSRIHDDWS